MFGKKEILHILKTEKIAVKKSLGQNFLVDKNLLQFIARTAQITQEDFILELGTGLGSLTGILAEKGGAILTVEKDPLLWEVAQKLLQNYPNITFFQGDALSTKNKLSSQWISLLPPQPIKVIANLPYNIASPLMILLLRSPIPILSCTFLIQRDVAEKIQAGPGKKNYGRLSVMMQVLSRIKVVRTVGPSVFYPAPKVDSALVQLWPKEKTLEPQEMALLEKILRVLFNRRRKKIGKILSQTLEVSRDFLSATLDKLGLSSSMRPEEISWEAWVALTKTLSSQNSS